MSSRKVCSSCEALNPPGSLACYACGEPFVANSRQPALASGHQALDAPLPRVTPDAPSHGPANLPLPLESHTTPPVWPGYVAASEWQKHSPSERWQGHGFYARSPSYSPSYLYSPAHGGYPHVSHPYMIPIPVVPRHEKLAITSFILALTSVAFCMPLGAVAAVLGAMSLRKIGRSEALLQGKSLAVAGIVIGLLATLWTLVLIAFIIANLDVLRSA